MNLVVVLVIVVILAAALVGGIYHYKTSTVASTTTAPTDTGGSAVTTPAPPVWLPLSGFDYPGNDMTGSPFQQLTQDQCSAKCQATTGCVAGQYAPSSQNCWLKNTLGDASGNADRVLLVPTVTTGVAAWNKQANMDHGGDDIACYTDGSPVSKCASLCAAHGNCKAFNYVSSAFGGGWAKGGCCVKKVNSPVTAGSNIDFYTGTR